MVHAPAWQGRLQSRQADTLLRARRLPAAAAAAAAALRGAHVAAPAAWRAAWCAQVEVEEGGESTTAEASDGALCERCAALQLTEALLRRGDVCRVRAHAHAATEEVKP